MYINNLSHNIIYTYIILDGYSNNVYVYLLYRIYIYNRICINSMYPKRNRSIIVQCRPSSPVVRRPSSVFVANEPLILDTYLLLFESVQWLVVNSRVLVLCICTLEQCLNRSRWPK